MSQQLRVNLIITVPDDYVLISKVELEELREGELSGVYWSMRDLEHRTKKKSEWIKENILYPQHLRKILDIDRGGFVFYPKIKGQNWSFHANKMAQFLDTYFNEIHSN